MRDNRIDVLKGVLIIIVVFGHALQLVNGGTGNPLHNYIRSFQMEAFFCVSGYVYALSLGKGVLGLRAIGNHARRLLVPYVVWVFLYWVVFHIFKHDGFPIRELGLSFVKSGFWFLRQLFIVILSFDLFFSVKISKLYRVVIPLSILLLTSVVPGNREILHYATFFLLGFYLNYRNKTCTQTAMLGQGGVIWLGRNSLGIYAIHWNVLFCWIHNRIINFHSLVLAGWNIYLVALAVGMAWLLCTICLVIIIKQNSVARVLLLGEK